MHENLIIAMKRNKITQKEIAKCIEVTERSVFNKIKKGNFTHTETVKIKNTFFPDSDLEELFKWVE